MLARFFVRAWLVHRISLTDAKTSRSNIAVFVYSSHIFLIFNYLSVETMIVEKLT